MQLEFWFEQCEGLCLLFWWVSGSWPMCISKSTHQTRSGWSTWQIRWESIFKSFVKTFPGTCLAGYTLHPSCLAGPLGEVQVVVGEFLPFQGIFGILYSRRSKSDGSTLPFLYKLSWGLEVKLKASIDLHTPLSSEHGVYRYSVHHCSLLDSCTSLFCGVRLAEGLVFFSQLNWWRDPYMLF